MCHGFLRHPYDVEDIVGLVRNVYGNKVAFHDGVSELASGLTLHRVGGHTAGLQIVRVWTRRGWVVVRSEEHTSELQSLMRISYAVFCLKKKKTTRQNTLNKHTKNKRQQTTTVSHTTRNTRTNLA